MRALILIAAVCAPSVAHAQIVNPISADTSQLASKAELATVQSSLCPPGTVAPQTEAVAAAAGSASTCLRSDARLPRITRAGMAPPTPSTGDWAITWSSPLPSPPVTLPIPMNTGTQPIVCNVTSSTTTGASGRCWLARTLPATILTLTALLSFDPNGAPAAGITVQVLAIPTTQ
ncbi:hypothetical protein M9979_12175 [Sphingomonas sp. RP10(2022)]|uniref:Ig-like domain-containing protein n=1 Tax=Sphingomonas liriopis TaxID=2949094 RepID=A0A9X2I0L3_9SPHN|nr:hypothetical protein [Sphingomonas liriopis]MCP3735630.1 hypothetical protein [Sphingomonas liriopis]